MGGRGADESTCAVQLLRMCCFVMMACKDTAVLDEDEGAASVRVLHRFMKCQDIDARNEGGLLDRMACGCLDLVPERRTCSRKESMCVYMYCADTLLVLHFAVD